MDKEHESICITPMSHKTCKIIPDLNTSNLMFVKTFVLKNAAEKFCLQQGVTFELVNTVTQTVSSYHESKVGAFVYRFRWSGTASSTFTNSIACLNKLVIVKTRAATIS